MKKDNRKHISSDLSSSSLQPTKVLNTSANSAQVVEEPVGNIVGTKSELNKLNVPNVKKDVPLSKIN